MYLGMMFTCCPIPIAEEAFLIKLEVVVTKKNKIEVIIDEGWYSQEDVSETLGWGERPICNKPAPKTHYGPCPEL